MIRPQYFFSNLAAARPSTNLRPVIFGHRFNMCDLTERLMTVTERPGHATAVVMAQTRIAAQKFLPTSYMELLQEGAVQNHDYTGYSVILQPTRTQADSA